MLFCLVNEMREFIRREIVLVISFILAVLSMAIVPPNMAYLGYIDYRTIAILFCLMIIVSGLRKLQVFDQVGENLLSKVASVRGLAAVMVLLCFFFSMLITNDVALITFVPFAIVTLNLAGRSEALIPIIILETVAANLGSMMTPMGNPQNLYLYGIADMTLADLLKLMLPFGAVSLIIILILAVLLTSSNPVECEVRHEYKRSERELIRLSIYVMLFAMEILVVMRVIDYRIGLLILICAVLVMDRRMLIFGADYSLLATFICLFIFIGNIKNVPEISLMLSNLVGGHEVITAVVTSQFISNVPAAILLSAFTDNIEGLIVGCNLGGLGTLIASMASLISFKQYSSTRNANKVEYIRKFTIINVGMLVVLLGVSYLI